LHFQIASKIRGYDDMKEIKKRSECPVSFSLDFFGDKWTLLIIRDIVLHGKHTFGDFLQSAEGIATNILTDRLKMLEEQGLLMKYPVAGKARVGYCLTEKGVTIIPIVIEMALWGVSQNNSDLKKELTAALRKDKAGVIRQLTSQHIQLYRLHKSNSTLNT